MSIDLARVEEIFAEAVSKTNAAAREAYLDVVCPGDAELRQRLEQLLSAHDAIGNPFKLPEANGSASGHIPVSEGPGTTIGPYKLLQQIGEGGMGVVFMAEQERPIWRSVALKVIKLGMDTRQVIARFEAERQALAMMDHPNIAHVVDAGTTETGRPYFVMELVKGAPITEFCDDRQLSIRQRLELFKPVCEAVQHAHQKGIIHRDLKPSNVLVAEYDNRAVPKVIDFGVAKATAQRLTERTMFTEFGQVIGTVEYMSPEQAKLNQLDIDTRSDIYSLGVLLYELLTGSTPFEQRRLREAAFDEVLRIIREEEPPKPSTRLSTSDTLPSVAANRDTEPARLTKDIRGELDWIVMKCLEKDRNRRYETANGLARDIERYLLDEPVQACPASKWYRFSKFVRRNKAAMLAAAGGLTFLLVGVLGLAISNGIIAAERNEKARALTQITAERDRAEQKFIRARSAVSNILTKPAMGLGQWSKLPPDLRKQIAQEATKFFEASLYEQSSDMSLQYETAVGYRLISEVQISFGEFSGSFEKIRRSVELLENVIVLRPNLCEYKRELAYSRYILGKHFKLQNRLEEAAFWLNRSIDLYEEILLKVPEGLDHARALRCLQMLAIVKQRRGDWLHESESIISRMIGVSANYVASSASYAEAVYADQANILNQIAWPMATSVDPQLFDITSAIKLAGHAIKLAPSNGTFWNTLGVAQYRSSEWRSAIESLEKSIGLRNGGDAFDWFFLALAHRRLDHQDEARKWFDKAVEWTEENAPKNKELTRFRAEAAELLGIREPPRADKADIKPMDESRAQSD